MRWVLAHDGPARRQLDDYFFGVRDALGFNEPVQLIYFGTITLTISPKKSGANPTSFTVPADQIRF